MIAPLRIIQTSMLDPEPKSLKTPAAIASLTNLMPASSSKSCLQPDSKTDMAAKDPEPIVMYGKWSDDP
ncbi:hypothetical protein NQ314_013250 [Rhamnusium bicolor]|uniref:Uncharacterized protein n=1 Tax=Rhamnusium bicolor TaxID=1586634 RepID=A0AAV8X7N9_9CUCU|nr:hypothetical protein NQ314_013250 [Rhamnusium bicolor]